MIDASKAAAYHQAAIATYQVSLYGLYTNAGVCDPIINGTVVDSVTARGNPNLITQITSSQVDVTEARKDLKEKQERFTCDECGKSVKSRNYLKLHKRTHTGEKPFACKQCSLSFSVRGNLYKHMRTHSGVKNYGCSYCGQMFRDSTSRNRHERLHTGEMPYRCEDCDQNFRYREMYKAHMMKTHGLDEEEVVSLPPGKKMKMDQSSSNSQGASGTQKGSTDVHHMSPKTVSSKGDDKIQNLSSAVQIIGNVILKKEVGLDSTGQKDKLANLSSFAYNTTAGPSAQCIGSEEQAEMSSLTEEDGDMAFEDTSPYKLMPLELQNTDAVSITRPEGPVLLQQVKNRIEQLQCSKCPKSFDNKSQLTRHQKMHKLLSVVKTASHASGSGSKVMAKKPVLSQGAGTARKTMRKQSPFVKVSTPDLPDSEEFSEENTLKSSLELSSLNPSSNSSSSQSGDHSIQIDASLPETFLQESVMTGVDDSCSDPAGSRAHSPSGESQEMLEMGDDTTRITKVEDQSGSSTDVSSMKEDPVAREQSAQSTENPDASVTKDTPQSSNTRDPPGGIILDGCECKICGRVLSRESYLIIHMRSHSGEKPFVCQFCGRGFTVSQNLYKHVRTHTGEKNHACPTCGRRFTTSSSRNRHMLRHSGDKPYPCTLCDEGFSYLEQLKSHCQKNHAYFDTSLLKKVEIDTYELSKGKKKKKSKKKSKKLIVAPGGVGSLVDGKLIFPYDNPSQAGNQGVITTNQAAEHMPTDSSGMLDPSLEISRQLSNIQEEDHAQLGDSTDPHFASSDPGQTDDGCSSGVRFMCSFCGSEFQSEHYLQHHMTIHKNERCYECPFCHQGFAMQAHLQAHLRNHADAKKYSCGICGKGFSVRSKLERHMLVHTGDKPNQCQLCQESFKYKHILKLHYRKMHPSFASSELAKKRGRPTKMDSSEGNDVNAESDGVFRSTDLEDGEVVLGMAVDSGRSVSRSAVNNPNDISVLKSNGLQGRKTILRLLTGGDVSQGLSRSSKNETSMRTHPEIYNIKKPGPSNSEEMSQNIQGGGMSEIDSNVPEHYKGEMSSGSHTVCSFNCVHCPLIFQHKKDLTEHLLTHSERQIDYSKQYGVFESDPIKDMEECDSVGQAWTITSGVQPNVCDVCGAMFSESRKYQQHMADHLESDKASVETSSQRDKLRPHCETSFQVVENSQSFSSKTTSKVKRKSAAKSALLPLNNSTSEEVCSICGDVFSTAELLEHHLKGHSDPVQDSNKNRVEERSSASTHTDDASSFVQSHQKQLMKSPVIKKEPEECLPEQTPLSECHDVARHDGYHGEGFIEESHQVECRHCLAMFNSFKALHDHMKVHEGQSVFNCPLCSSVFHKQDQLLEHLKEHTGA
ncbi:zinc finger protein 236-like [Haliotis rubra]|uniref:zinc finger protein 236-like n=1 Tax=Haliotis rubra TaxID=36100 RepID=UPI001EE5803A|nr:zinc finger protein 236-like [Haliotis rubra]